MIEAIAVDEIQASAGAQIASASVPLLWMNRSGRVRPEFVEIQHSGTALLVLSIPVMGGVARRALAMKV